MRQCTVALRASPNVALAFSANGYEYGKILKPSTSVEIQHWSESELNFYSQLKIALLVYLSFSSLTCHPSTLLSNPHENKLQQALALVSSPQEVEQTIRWWPWPFLRGSRVSLTPLMSNKRMWRLSCGRAIILFTGDTESLFTEESVLIVVSGERMFFKSHTLTVLSSLPLTTMSFVVNAVDLTVLWNKQAIKHQ